METEDQTLAYNGMKALGLPIREISDKSAKYYNDSWETAGALIEKVLAEGYILRIHPDRFKGKTARKVIKASIALILPGESK